MANIRKMINWERQTIEKEHLEIAEIKKCFMNLYRAVQEKISNHEKFIQHIKHELMTKEKLARQFQNVDDELEGSAFLMFEKLKDTFGKANTIKEEKKVIYDGIRLCNLLYYYNRELDYLKEITVIFKRTSKILKENTKRSLQ